jgi:hypothetical protein
MRTTLTIDDDVAVQLDRLRRQQRLSLKAAVNDALRKGLKEMHGAGNARRAAHRTRVFDLGHAKLASLDNAVEALAIAEGEDFR